MGKIKGGLRSELECNHVKTAKSNTPERTCYQDRFRTILQPGAKSHDNHTYPQYQNNLPEYARGMERERL